VITRDPVPAQPSAVPGGDRKSRAAPRRAGNRRPWPHRRPPSPPASPV